MGPCMCLKALKTQKKYFFFFKLALFCLGALNVFEEGYTSNMILSYGGHQ